MNDYSLGTTFVVIPLNQIKMMYMFMCRYSGVCVFNLMINLKHKYASDMPSSWRTLLSKSTGPSPSAVNDLRLRRRGLPHSLKCQRSEQSSISYFDSDSWVLDLLVQPILNCSLLWYTKTFVNSWSPCEEVWTIINLR